MNYKMKKIIITILIIIFTASPVTTYAQFFKDKEPSAARTSSSSYDTDYSNAGFFRNPNNNGPGDRPGDGEGIGQEAPLGDGINAIITCCVIFGFVKIYNEKRRKD